MLLNSLPDSGCITRAPAPQPSIESLYNQVAIKHAWLATTPTRCCNLVLMLASWITVVAVIQCNSEPQQHLLLTTSSVPVVPSTMTMGRRNAKVQIYLDSSLPSESFVLHILLRWYMLNRRCVHLERCIRAVSLPKRVLLESLNRWLCR
jgi:hypothetical protein